jgi:exosortase F-associated protein
MRPLDEFGLSRTLRIALVIFGVAGLVIVFLFQQTGFLGQLVNKASHPYLSFSFNRTVRLLLNDFFMLLLLAGWFRSRSVLQLAFAIQLIDFFVLLPVYLLVKLNVEGDIEISSPLLSQFHRLIVNPTLMILLIPAVYFQRFIKKE